VFYLIAFPKVKEWAYRMKIIPLIFLSVAIAMPLAAQDATSSALRRTCTNIAAKLYPDVTNQNSDLLGLIAKMEKVLKVRDSGVFELDQEPLVVAAAAADILKIQPNWSALTDSEKETAYYSLADAMIFTHDFTAKDAEASNQPSSPPTWKQGDDLGTITTTNGTVYSMAKLQSVDPDGVTILDSDGGAKISFEKLSPDLQKRFGYDPQKANSYAQQQAYENQIDQLRQENAKLRQRLNMAADDAQAAQAAPKIGIEAYHCYLFQTVVSLLRTGRVVGGPYDKMMEDEATAYAQQKWGTLSDDEKMAYEKMAQQTGDPIAHRDAVNASEPSTVPVRILQGQGE
jgi:hypothetical protein